MKPTEQILKEWSLISKGKNLEIEPADFVHATYHRLLEALQVANWTLKELKCRCLEENDYGPTPVEMPISCKRCMRSEEHTSELQSR